jgi:D-sedoheptulose 7-phosphate isomerase
MSDSSSQLKPWIADYLATQKALLDAIPVDSVAAIVDLFRRALAEDRQIFVFGNGGSACNASHFATDLGKGASDKLDRRFRIMSLNDNTSWITALGNDYLYEDIFVRQLMNFARPGDLILVMSVSGSSPNLVKAVEWAKKNGLFTISLVGAKKGVLAEISDHVIVAPESHYGRAEDTHMMICHMLCYSFMELPGLSR